MLTLNLIHLFMVEAYLTTHYVTLIFFFSLRFLYIHCSYGGLILHLITLVTQTHVRTQAHTCTHLRTHTHTVGRNPLDDGSARLIDLYLTTRNTYKRQISMPRTGFESDQRTAADLLLRQRDHRQR